MMCSARNLVRVTKFLLAGVTVFCVSWLASVGEWPGGAGWAEGGRRRATTMRTIVAYSESKRAEMERPYPVACEQLPAMPAVKHINRTWSAGVKWEEQSSWQQVPGTKVTIFNAYYDERLAQHYIRILAMFPGRVFPPSKQLYCQTRSQDKNTIDSEATVEVVAAKPLEIWYPEWDTETIPIKTALLLSCPLTEPLTGPTILSIVTEPCENPGNAFIVESNETPASKRNFTICVKDMNFEEDISAKLVEWIETNRILGVDKIDMYIDRVHKNTVQILKYYTATGFLRLFHVPINNYPDTGVWQRRRNHVVTFNDCLYRNLKESEFIIPLDVDEIIIPKTVENLPNLIEKLKIIGWKVKESTAAIIRNVFFFDVLQQYNQFKSKTDVISEIYIKRDDVRICKDFALENININYDNEVIEHKNEEEELNNKYKLRCGKNIEEPRLVRHVTRSNLVSPKGSYSKSVLVTNNVLTAFNHYPLSAISSYKTYWFAPFREVQINHYKESCNATLVGECWKYQQQTRRDCSALRLRRQLRRALALAPCFN